MATPSPSAGWRSDDARAYKTTAGLIANGQKVRIQDGELLVRLHVYRPHRMGDLDGALKVLLDSLNGIAWVDDKQVAGIEAYRHEDKADPRVEVEVLPLAS